MATEPGWEVGVAARAGDTVHTAGARTEAEERLLTEFARNYLLGRRWLCRFVHACVALGVAIGALASGWDHLMDAFARAVRGLTAGQ